MCRRRKWAGWPERLCGTEGKGYIKTSKRASSSLNRPSFPLFRQPYNLRDWTNTGGTEQEEGSCLYCGALAQLWLWLQDLHHYQDLAAYSSPTSLPISSMPSPFSSCYSSWVSLAPSKPSYLLLACRYIPLFDIHQGKTGMHQRV